MTSPWGKPSAERTSRRSDRSEMVRPILVYRDSQTVANYCSSSHSALKEFFGPSRINDSRTDFFAVYRREFGEFDQDDANKYDENLNTSLIPTSRLVSTFAVGVPQSHLPLEFLLPLTLYEVR